MTEMIITLDDSVSSSLYKKVLENTKGVIDIKIRKNNSEDSRELRKQRLHQLSNGIDTSYIDYDDEKTRYILSK